MASFLTYLLEGDNYTQFERIARSGDISPFGIIGRNLTIINQHERVLADLGVIDAVADARLIADRTAEAAEAGIVNAALKEAATVEARKRAMVRTARIIESDNDHVRFAPDSDAGVDDFILGM